MAVQHSSITDPNIHEPKGIASAVSGDIYVADGLGSGVWRQATEVSGAMVITNNSTGIAFTAAVDPTLSTFSDYIKLTGFSSGELDKITFSSNELTIPAGGGGLYLVDFYCTIKSTINNTNFAVKFAVNGSSGVSRRPQAPLITSGTVYNLSACGLVSLSDGDVLSLYGASDKTATLTIQDAALLFHKVGI